jgi:hypothetical protein
MRFLHIFTIIGALAGLRELLQVLSSSTIGPQQQAAGAAIAVALVVLPYCFVRALVEMDGGPQSVELKRLNDSLSTHTRLLAEMADVGAQQEVIDHTGRRARF